jgi:hypothetical protein
VQFIPDVVSSFGQDLEIASASASWLCEHGSPCPGTVVADLCDGWTKGNASEFCEASFRIPVEDD